MCFSFQKVDEDKRAITRVVRLSEAKPLLQLFNQVLVL